MRNAVFVAIVGAVSLAASGAAPDCSGVERWATKSAHSYLLSEGIVTRESLDLTKTRTELLASEKIGADMYRQVHHVSFARRDGAVVDVITKNEASSQECSMSPVTVYVVSKRLGGK